MCSFIAYCPSSDRTIDPVTTRSNRSGRATTPGRIRIRRGTCGRRAAPWTRRSGCPRPDRVRAPFGCADHDRTDLLVSEVIGEPDDATWTMPGWPARIPSTSRGLTQGRLGPGCCEARPPLPEGDRRRVLSLPGAAGWSDSRCRGWSCPVLGARAGHPRRVGLQHRLHRARSNTRQRLSRLT